MLRLSAEERSRSRPCRLGRARCWRPNRVCSAWRHLWLRRRCWCLESERAVGAAASVQPCCCRSRSCRWERRRSRGRRSTLCRDPACATQNYNIRMNPFCHKKFSLYESIITAGHETCGRALISESQTPQGERLSGGCRRPGLCRAGRLVRPASKASVRSIMGDVACNRDVIGAKNHA